MLQSSRMTAGMTYSGSDAEDKAVYKAMERAVKAKKIRSIGISNYYTEKTAKRFFADFEIKPAVVQMRWHVQSGYIAIPGSKNPNHIAENISIFDFELTDDEMKQIAVLDTGHRYENW